MLKDRGDYPLRTLGGSLARVRGGAYPVTVAGLGVGGIGASTLDATGDVYNLASINLFPGAYAQGQYGFVIGTMSRGGLWLQNQTGVVMHLKGEREGLILSLGGDAMVIVKLLATPLVQGVPTGLGGNHRCFDTAQIRNTWWLGYRRTGLGVIRPAGRAGGQSKHRQKPCPRRARRSALIWPVAIPRARSSRPITSRQTPISSAI